MKPAEIVNYPSTARCPKVLGPCDAHTMVMKRQKCRWLMDIQMYQRGQVRIAESPKNDILNVSETISEFSH